MLFDAKFTGEKDTCDCDVHIENRSDRGIEYTSELQIWLDEERRWEIVDTDTTFSADADSQIDNWLARTEDAGDYRVVEAVTDALIDRMGFEQIARVAIEAHEKALAKQGKEIVFSAELKRLRQNASRHGL